MADLRFRQATAALALEFAILTAARSGEVLGARWDEFDLERTLWTVPPERMKAGREHRLPLSPRALKIVKAMQEVRNGDFVFPGQKSGKLLSPMTLGMALRRPKVDGAAVHGFRSAFRDWAAECTNFPSEVVEMALAHAVTDKVEAALSARRSVRQASSWKRGRYTVQRRRLARS
jgi:integrase